MLHITASTKTLLSETNSAITFVSQVVDYLRAITPEKEYVNYIATLVRSVPEYKVIARDAADAKQLLRKVCTQEVSIYDALKFFEDALRELRALASALGTMRFPFS